MAADISAAIGLSDEDTTDLLTKYYGFFHSLNPAQQAVVQKCIPSFDEAAAAIGQGTSAADIQKYVAGRLASQTVQAFPVPVGQATATPVPAAPSTTGTPVPTTQSVTATPVPTAHSAAGFPVPIKKSK